MIINVQLISVILRKNYKFNYEYLVNKNCNYLLNLNYRAK